jgi:hypothetical protein
LVAQPRGRVTIAAILRGGSVACLVALALLLWEESDV